MPFFFFLRQAQYKLWSLLLWGRPRLQRSLSCICASPGRRPGAGGGTTSKHPSPGDRCHSHGRQPRPFISVLGRNAVQRPINYSLSICRVLAGAAGASLPRRCWEGPLPGTGVLSRCFPCWKGFRCCPECEGFADLTACNLTPGLETPPEATPGPVPRSSVPRTGCNHLLAGQPWPERSGSQQISPASLSICKKKKKKNPKIYSWQLSWVEKKNMLLFTSILNFGFFFFSCNRGCQ